MSFSDPWGLLLAGLAPVICWRLRASASRPLKLWLCLLLGLIALAAAGPRAGSQSDRRRIFLLIDRSASYRGGAERSLAGLPERLSARDQIWLVPFGGGPALAAGPIAPEQLPAALARISEVGIDAQATSVGQALRFLATLEPRPGDVLLLSDGIDSQRGQVWQAPSGKRVFVLAPKPQPDMRLVAVRTPPALLPGVRFGIAVDVASTSAGKAQLELKRGGKVIVRRSVVLEGPGQLTLLLSDRVSAAGWVDYQLQLMPAAGQAEQTLANNRYTLRRLVGRKPGVLWLCASGQPSELLGALADRLQLQFARPDSLHPRQLADVTAVVLDDLAARRMTDAVEARLVQFIQAGGGCLFLGGQRSLADGGWIERPLERELPVWLRPRSRPRPPAAVAVLIDCSGSMAGRKLQMAAVALGDLIETLEDGTELTVWSFAYSHQLLLPRVKLGKARQPLMAQIQRRLLAGRGTRFEPVLSAAHKELAASKLANRILIMITDGQTQEQRLAVGDLRKSGVALQVLLTGDRESAALSDLIDQADGKTLRVTQLKNLPLFLLAQYRSKRWEMLVPGPVPVRAVSSRLGRLAQVKFPPLAGSCRTSLKPGATALLLAGKKPGHPVYASWMRAGGRVAYLALDLEGPWGISYRAWPERGNLLGHALLWTAGGERLRPVSLRAEFTDGLVELVAVVRGNVPRPRLQVIARAGEQTQSTRLVAVAPGVYRARLALTPGLIWRLRLQEIGRSRTLDSRQIGVPYGPELARLAPRPGPLAQLARASGGGWLTSIARYQPSPAARRPGRDLSDICWLLAGLLLLLGVGFPRWVGR